MYESVRHTEFMLDYDETELTPGDRQSLKELLDDLNRRFPQSHRLEHNPDEQKWKVT